MDSFEFEPHRDTQTAGALEPPRRRPPTAVGTGQLPPRHPGNGDLDESPEGDDEPYPASSRLRRIALALLGLQLVGAAVLIAWPLGWRDWVIVGATLAARALWQRTRPVCVRPPKGSASEAPQEQPRRRSA